MALFEFVIDDAARAKREQLERFREALFSPEKSLGYETMEQAGPMMPGMERPDITAETIKPATGLFRESPDLGQAAQAVVGTGLESQFLPYMMQQKFPTAETSKYQGWQPQLVEIGGETQYAVPVMNRVTGNVEWRPAGTAPGAEGDGVKVTPTQETPQQKRQAEIKTAIDKKYMEKMGGEAASTYAKIQRAAQEASTFVPRLKKLQALASNIKTGKYAPAKLYAKQLFGIDSADEEVLNAKLGALAQDILNQQTGTKTDFDFKNAVAQAASLGKTQAANIALIQAIIDRQNQAIRLGDQARKAYSKSGAKGVLDMRYEPQQPVAQPVMTAPPAAPAPQPSVEDLVNKYKTPR